jgi:tetratricopeptide (TPR) repeat protein
MKRTFSLWLGLATAAGLLGLALTPVVAQAPAPAPAPTTGKIHGHVSNPTGQAQGVGTVSLTNDGGKTLKFTFPVGSDGNYAGEAPQGTYSAVYRAPDTPAGQIVDEVMNVKILAGQELTVDIDMSRQAFIDKLPAEEKKQLEEMKKANATVLKENQVITQLNTDLKTVAEDKKAIDTAYTAAVQALGQSATKTDVAAKEAEIKTAKYTDIESLMTKDTAVRADEALLWTNLGFGQAGLKKYDDAIISYKKALDLETAAKKPRATVLGLANSGLGEIYARTGKIPEANAAYDAAAKSDPADASLFLRNEAIIFLQQNNGDAQIAAADEAIKVDPNNALLYYIKGQGLIQKATVDTKTNHIVLPADCTAAYQKYLELAPTGPYAKEVAGILQQAGEKTKK